MLAKHNQDSLCSSEILIELESGYYGWAPINTQAKVCDEYWLVLKLQSEVHGKLIGTRFPWTSKQFVEVGDGSWNDTFHRQIVSNLSTKHQSNRSGGILVSSYLVLLVLRDVSLSVPFPFFCAEVAPLLEFAVTLCFERNPFKFAMPVTLGSSGHSAHCNWLC